MNALGFFGFALLALAGGTGAASRLLVDTLVRAKFGARLPWGTIAINLSGSFVLGLAIGLLAGGVLTPAAELVVGTGFLGGYTTFSTASVETVRLVQERRWGAAALNAFGVLLAGTALAGCGYALGAAL